MLLSHTAEYALRVMTTIARWEGDEPPRAPDLAEQVCAPQHSLSKVLRKLVLAELLHSRKGHGGGFALARPPSRIRFVEILEAVDFDADDGRCAFGWSACSSSDPCPLHPAYRELRQAFLSWARRTRLSSVCDQRRRRLTL